MLGRPPVKMLRSLVQRVISAIVACSMMLGVPGVATSGTTVGSPSARSNSVPIVAPTPSPPRGRRSLTGAATDIPADPRQFLRNHAPLPRPTMPPMAHLTHRPAPQIRPEHVSGVRMAGPFVGRGVPDPSKTSRNSGAAVQEFLARHPKSALGILHVHSKAPRTSTTAGASLRRTTSSVDTTQLNVTGINRWWSYEEGDIPGVGRWMVNTHWQNLIIQSDDMDVPYRGIDLAFRRTYNSYSNHDFAGSDGSAEIGQYGNGWTNTFDAHMSGNNCPNPGYSWGGYSGFSVYDVDGARYDYCFNAAGQLVAPPGMQGTALIANPDGGSFFWQKKSGTVYTFFAPYYGGASAAVSGRIYRISARNNNNYIQFTYAWSPDASSSANLTNIYATTDSGLQATLTFADFNGQRLLSQLTRPDGTVVTYAYDGSGNLLSVGKPPPNSSGQPVYQGYGGYRNFLWVNNPRWNATYNPTTNTSTDGGYVAFQQTSSGATTGIQWVGVMNPGPSYLNDGTNTYLQPGVQTGAFQYRFESVSATSAYTAFSDTDGHSIVQYIDGSGPFGDPGRPTTRQEYTGSSWLQTYDYWDVNNNLIATTDARSNRTDYAYDANGNAIAVAEPQTTTSQGTFRPTRLFSYDGFNNVVAYCDETISNAAGANWGSGAPSDLVSRCRASTASRFTFDNPSYQPYGRLVSTTAPDGYQTQYQYDPQKQGGGGVDYGLPTLVSGASVTQYDGSPLNPQQSFWYDSSGYLRCYSKGFGTWVLEYDAMGRQTLLSDPDNAGNERIAICGTHYSGTYGRTLTTYFPDGTVQSRQTPPQVLFGAQSTYGYDLDDNVMTETSFHGCTAAPCLGAATSKYYDGADRLVEVMQPNDHADPTQQMPWITRYLYDISGGQQISFKGTPVIAHGNLYKTQEVYPSPAQPFEMKGQGFDALDRLTNTYTLEPGNDSTVRTTTTVYDSTPTTLGMATSKTDALGEVALFDYDSIGRVASTRFTGDGGVTPDRNITYDPSGRIARIDSAILGTQRMVYDLLGRTTEVDEFTGGTVALSSPAQLRYAYYPNGLRKSLSVSSTALTADPLVSYAYRNDGARTKLLFSKGGVNSNFSWTYTDAGRVSTQYDPFTGMAIPRPNYLAPPGPVYSGAQYGYDNGFGLATVQLPVNGNFVIQRDAEGSPVSYTSTLPFLNAPMTVSGSLYVTSRDETTGLAVTQTASDGTSTTASIYSKLALRGCLLDGGPSSQDPSGCDARTGATTSPGGSGIPYYCSGYYASSSYTYDKAGRRTAGRSVQVDPDSCNDVGWNGSWSYDAEDHVISASGQGVPYANGCGGTNRWNPLGHPALMCSATLHYDGDLVLFTSTPQGSLDHLNVEKLGSLRPDNSVLVNDRDYAGMTVMQHGNSGYSSWDSSYTATRYKSTQTIGSIVPGSDGALPADSLLVPFNYTRSDGFESPFGTIQGTRVSNSDGWTTPDAFAGEVHDPMSQKSFMWNRNNPYAYSDPSGYAPWWEEVAAMLGRVLRSESPFAPSTVRLEKGLTTSTGTLTPLGARVMGTLREIPLSRGEFGIGSVGDVQQAKSLGDLWVGPGARQLSNGLGKISADGSKVFRDPVIKSDGTMQANFEVRDANGNVTANGHLDIRPGGGINVSPEYLRGSGTPPNYKGQ